MDTTHNRPTLIIHHGAPWRADVVSMLARMNVACVESDSIAGLSRAVAGQRIEVVVLNAARSGHGSAGNAVARLRELLLNARVIAILPVADTRAMREAFRAGACDCLEERGNAIELTRRIAASIQSLNTASMSAGASRHGVGGQLVRRAQTALERITGRGVQRPNWSSPTNSSLTGDHPGWTAARHEAIKDSLPGRQLQRAQMETVRALAAAAEAKDPYMRAHSQTVARYSEAIGRRMGMDSPRISQLRTAALLHDIGKIAVPDAILTKPGPLTPDEFRVIKRHPETAIDILRHLGFLADERNLILHHHERFDGGGYPAGLAGERIPVGARVLAMADALDAMLSSRSYKPAYDMKRVRAELHQATGRQFDPRVTQVALSWLGESCRPTAPIREAAPA